MSELLPQSQLDQWTDWARRDDWHQRFVGSDIRQMLGEIARLRAHAPPASPCGEEVEPDELADMIADRSSDRAADLIVKNFAVFRRDAAPVPQSAARIDEPQRAPASCPHCIDATDCASVDVCCAVEAAVRERIAAFLLARDEEDISTPVADHLIEWAKTVMHAGKGAVHSGDCTKESHSCLRCLHDRTLAHADQLLAALSRPAHGGWEEAVAKCLQIADNHSRKVIQNEGDAELYADGWTDGAKNIASAIRSLARNDRGTSQPDTGEKP